MSYGASRDYWSFADTNIHLIASNTGVNKSEATAEDSFGDIVATTIYDTTSDFSSQYVSCADTALVLYDTTTAVDKRVGKVITDTTYGTRVITGIEVATTNNGRPTITISGRSIPSTVSDGDISYYDPSTLEISGARKAAAVGISVDTATKLVSATIGLETQTAATQDSGGEICIIDVYGGRVTCNASFVGVTGAPGASADTGYTLSDGPSVEESNTGYATGSATVYQNLSRM